MSKIYDYNGGGIDEGVRIRIRIRIKLGINISVKRIVRSSDFLQILVGERSNNDKNSNINKEDKIIRNKKYNRRDDMINMMK